MAFLLNSGEVPALYFAELPIDALMSLTNVRIKSSPQSRATTAIAKNKNKKAIRTQTRMFTTLLLTIISLTQLLFITIILSSPSLSVQKLASAKEEQFDTHIIPLFSRFVKMFYKKLAL